MGNRAGQGYGVQKPKRDRCPDCSKKGVTLPTLSLRGWFRQCQYCCSRWDWKENGAPSEWKTALKQMLESKS
jgi:hypothetical protein